MGEKVGEAGGRSKTSRIHSRYVSSKMGKEEKRAATASKSAARLRCCHKGPRNPPRLLGSSNARPAASRNFAANKEVEPRCRSTKSRISTRGGPNNSYPP